MATKSSPYPAAASPGDGLAVEAQGQPGAGPDQPPSGKWASCGSDGVLTVAKDLATAVEDFDDYVLVHGLQLKDLDHGKQSKAMVTALVPS